MKVTDFVTGVVVPLVTAITGIFVFSLDRQVKTFDGQLKVREATRLDTAEQRQSAQQQVDLRFRIYDAATKSLESGDARNQHVATSLVIAMLEPDDPLRSGLLEVLTNQAEPAVKEQAKNALQESSQFIAQQALAPVAAATVSSDDWRAYNLDLFWCAAVGSSAKDKAERIEQALHNAGSKGRLRVRELGATINASPGYRISGLMIRREGNEASAAEAVKKIADSSAGDSGGFLLTNSSQGTPGYMSLFVCQ
jgi:hypothetical protein